MNKAFYIVTFLLFITTVGHSQENEKLFAMIYSKGEEWNDSISTSGQPYFKEHSLHLQKLRKQNKIVVGGRYSDVGFMILQAKDMAEANEITKQDSSVAKGIFKVELFEFSTFYEGCIDNDR
ncbi:YciI family protein [Altibacter sp.]|uniref:YciI family protein n=1 Tax=Altibacter sp. TaxID=2024823 RepID=UPI0025877153|nr:YciI family protein [Altibacter sp.]MCW9037276.1 YciI family protein [Altibacter sp.]